MKKLLYFLPLVALSVACEKELVKTIDEIEEPLSGQVTTINNGKEGDADGNLSTALFNEPKGIVAGPDGSLFIVDGDNFKIKKVSPEGEVSTFAGSVKGFTDGKDRLHSLHLPGE